MILLIYFSFRLIPLFLDAVVVLLNVQNKNKHNPNIIAICWLRVSFIFPLKTFLSFKITSALIKVTLYIFHGELTTKKCICNFFMVSVFLYFFRCTSNTDSEVIMH